MRRIGIPIESRQSRVVRRVISSLWHWLLAASVLAPTHGMQTSHATRAKAEHNLEEVWNRLLVRESNPIVPLLRSFGGSIVGHDFSHGFKRTTT